MNRKTFVRRHRTFAVLWLVAAVAVLALSAALFGMAGIVLAFLASFCAVAMTIEVSEADRVDADR